MSALVFVAFVAGINVGLFACCLQDWWFDRQEDAA